MKEEQENSLILETLAENDDAFDTAPLADLNAPSIPDQELDNAIECILFCSTSALTSRNLHHMLSEQADLTSIKASLNRLTEKFDGEGTGLKLESFKHGYQFRTKPEYAPYLQTFMRKRPWRVSRQAMEVVAIIAYRQPIHRASVDEIRGTDSGHLIHTLIDKGLVKMAGRAEDLPGKPINYATTDRFLEVFSLHSLKDLPTLEETEQELEAN